MIPTQRLHEILDRFAFVEAKMNETSDPTDIAALGREYARLRSVVETIQNWQSAQDDMAAAEEMQADPEMADLAAEEIADLRERMPELEEELRIALLPKDAADDRPAILEIRPGTGGDEAALFAGDLFRMYQRFADAQGWKVEIIEEDAAELGGFKEIVAAIRGDGVFAKLKFESGVHRVQRVPETESQGRIHSSAATVAVLPEAEEIDIEIPASDIRIDTYRSSGAGGQHVNVTDSAVRITHIPTGLVTACQNERSQHQNKDRAMQMMAAKPLDLERKKREDEIAGITGEQQNVGFGSQIRSYVMQPYQMVKDLRTEHETAQVEQVLGGDVEQFMEAWLRWTRAQAESE